MKVAWVTHHLPVPVDPDEARARGLLAGQLAGGAEMCDAAMIAHAPEGVAVTMIEPRDWEQAFDYDRVIVTGTDHLTDDAMLALSNLHPIVWVHHEQTPNRARRDLFAAADPFVTMSRAHRDLEATWSSDSQVCHGWIDSADVSPGDKADHALWAARNHRQKGRINARLWAARTGTPLVELTDVPRADVLDAMSIARYFVFLPKAFDSCPRTLIEAELAGCEIVTNDLAGRREPGNIRDVLAAQPATFWAWL